MRDDRGPFLAVGASLFAAASLYRSDRARLERILRFLASAGVDYIRALACVGAQPYWQGREVDPAWPDYEDVILGTTALALACGLRVQWTCFGDAQVMAPEMTTKRRVVSVVARACQLHREAVIAVEGANESWQNGFPGAEGVQQLRELARMFADLCPGVPIATSCPFGENEEQQMASARALYEGSAATYSTNHYDRQMGEEGWRPVRQPWQYTNYSGVPDACLNNEPIGIDVPGGSNPTDSDPHRQVSQAVVSWLSGHWGYTLHDRTAGTRCDRDWSDVKNIDAITSGLKAVRGLLPADFPNWTPQQDGAAGGPFQNVPNWVDPPALGGGGAGVVRQYSSTDGRRFFAFPLGIHSHVDEVAKAAMTVEAFNILTGDLVERRDLSSGQSMRLTDAQPVYLVRGEWR
jgi:hypothetical protein